MNIIDTHAHIDQLEDLPGALARADESGVSDIVAVSVDLDSMNMVLAIAGLVFSAAVVAYVFAQLGISLPHYTAGQYSLGTPVSRDQLQPGDLVFFDGLGHVGIYIGAGQFIHAPHTGDVVKVSSLSESWYASTYVGARRI